MKNEFKSRPVYLQRDDKQASKHIDYSICSEVLLFSKFSSIIHKLPFERIFLSSSILAIAILKGMPFFEINKHNTYINNQNYILLLFL